MWSFDGGMMSKEQISFESDKLPYFVKMFMEEYKGKDIVIMKKGKEVYKITQEKPKNKVLEEPLKSFVNNCIAHLNTKVKRGFRVQGKNVTLLVALYKAKFTYEDVKAVIDSKSLEWKNQINTKTGKPMSIYLRPETLFNIDKFEGYVNENSAAGNSGDGNGNWKG